DYLAGLGTPETYASSHADCKKFLSLFTEAHAALQQTTCSSVFELSMIFLSIRNFASCYALGRGSPDFSRDSALHLGADQLRLDMDAYRICRRARILSTRGYGPDLTPAEIAYVSQA